MRGLILWIAGVAAALYALFALLLFIKQRDFLYPRHLISYSVKSPPARFNAVVIPTADGEKLRAWHAPPGEGRPTILALHGNGDTLEGLAPRFAALAARGYGVLGLAFRGYPGSSVSPSEKGLGLDAAAALDWLAANGVPGDRVVLHGRSLGTGPAISLAAERPVGALVLESPDMSILELARSQFPIFPVRLLLHDQFLSRLTSSAR